MLTTTTMATLQANWPALLGAALLVLALAYWLLTRRKAPPARREGADVLSEGAARAIRNSALIDAPPVASFTATTLAAGVLATEPVMAVAVEAPPPPPAPDTDGDDLSRIKGLGPKLRARLAELGVTRFDQIAAWSETDLVAIDAQLGTFAGRPAKDNWIEQARLLASGDLADYEGKFGKV